MIQNHPVAQGGGGNGNVNLIQNPNAGPAAGFAPPPVVPVSPAGGGPRGDSLGGNSQLKFIVEAPPVTELVGETPMDNGMAASSGLNVIGGRCFFYDQYELGIYNRELVCDDNCHFFPRDLGKPFSLFPSFRWLQ